MPKATVSKPKTNKAKTILKKVVVTSHHQAKAILGAQGQRLLPTISHEMCGTTGLSACLVYMPPGRTARTHLHEHNDIIVVVVEGYAATLVGENMEPHFHGPGEFLYVPEGIVHTAVNLSTTNRLIAMEFHTEAHFNEDVVPKPEYEEVAAPIIAKLQKQFAAGTLKLPEHWDTTNTGPFTFPDMQETDLL